MLVCSHNYQRQITFVQIAIIQCQQSHQLKEKTNRNHYYNRCQQVNDRMAWQKDSHIAARDSMVTNVQLAAFFTLYNQAVSCPCY